MAEYYHVSTLKLNNNTYDRLLKVVAKHPRKERGNRFKVIDAVEEAVIDYIEKYEKK